MAGDYLSLASPGEVVECDDQWPLITFRNNHAIQLPGLTQETLARRVAECINFCQGVDLTDTGFDSLKALLASLNDHDSIARREINSIWPIRSPADTKTTAT